jgi:hypothetical protein
MVVEPTLPLLLYTAPATLLCPVRLILPLFLCAPFLCPHPLAQDRFRAELPLAAPREGALVALFVSPLASCETDTQLYFATRAEVQQGPPITSVAVGIEGDVIRDILRTFQQEGFFQEGQAGQEMLSNVLFGFVKATPEVGYCQGMNYVAAAILMGRTPSAYSRLASIESRGARYSQQSQGEASAALEQEQEQEQSAGAGAESLPELTASQRDEIELDAFLMLREMVRTTDLGTAASKLDMAGLWKDRVPRLKLRIYQLDRLLKWTYPALHAHFVKIELSPEVLTTQWFITLFAYTFPVQPTVLQLWDYIFLTGWEGLFRVALSLLGSLKDRLLELDDFEAVVMLMREWQRQGRVIIQESVRHILLRAEEYIVTHEVLSRLQEAFANEILSIAFIRSEEQLPKFDSTASSTGGVGQKQSLGTGIPSAFRMGAFSLAGKSFGDLSRSSSPVPGSAGSSAAASSGAGNGYMASLSPGQQKQQLQRQKMMRRQLEASEEEEREKLMLLQQQSGSVELPTFWLLRFSSKLPPHILSELRKIKTDLMAMDKQVDVDKHHMQNKIIRSCDFHRETVEELARQMSSVMEAEKRVEKERQRLQAALAKAREIALEAVELMEGGSRSDSTDSAASRGGSFFPRWASRSGAGAEHAHSALAKTESSEVDGAAAGKDSKTPGSSSDQLGEAMEGLSVARGESAGTGVQAGSKRNGRVLKSPTAEAADAGGEGSERLASSKRLGSTIFGAYSVVQMVNSCSWDFPVASFVHNITSPVDVRSDRKNGKMQPQKGAASTGDSFAAAPSPPLSSRREAQRMKALEQSGQSMQREIIEIDRSLEYSQEGLQVAQQRLEQAQVSSRDTTLCVPARFC